MIVATNLLENFENCTSFQSLDISTNNLIPVLFVNITTF